MSGGPHPMPERRTIMTQVNLGSIHAYGVERILDHLQATAGVNAVRIHADDRIVRFAHLHGDDDQAPAWNLCGVPMRHRGIGRLASQPYCAVLEPQERERLLLDLRRSLDARGMTLHLRGIWGYDDARPGYSGAMMVDAWGRTLRVPCWTNPAMRDLLRQVGEDAFRRGPIAIDGYTHMAEYGGAWAGALSGGHGIGACFCPSCCEAGHRLGLDVAAARAGWRELEGPEALAAAGSGGIHVWLARHPMVLAWDALMGESFREALAVISGVARLCHPQAEIGVHVLHTASWNAVQRESVYAPAALAPIVDSVHPLLYTRLSGHRIQGSVRRFQRLFLPHLSLDQVWPQFLDWNGIPSATQPPWSAIVDGADLDADYVGAVSAAWRRDLPSRVRVIANVGWEDEWSEAPTDPRATATYASVRAAIAAGCQGVLLSRGFSADLCFADRERAPTIQEISAGHARLPVDGDVGPLTLNAAGAALADAGWIPACTTSSC